MTTKQVDGAVDIMKFVCAILVVAIHTTPLAGTHERLSFGISQILARFAVPFFFVAAGYYFSKKLTTTHNKKQVLLSYLKKIFGLYLGWSLIYFFFDISELLTLYNYDIFNVILTYLRNFIFAWSHFHLWYLPALLFGTVVLYRGSKKHRRPKLLACSCICYLLGLLWDSYHWFLPKGTIIFDLYLLYFKLFKTITNGVFFWMIYLSLGWYIARRSTLLSRQRSLIYASITFVFLLIEAFFLHVYSTPKDYNLYLMLLPLTYFLFSYLVQLDPRISPFFSQQLRRYSLGIYLIHGLFLVLYRPLLYQETFFSDNHSFVFFLVIASSLASLRIINKLDIPFLRSIIR